VGTRGQERSIALAPEGKMDGVLLATASKIKQTVGFASIHPFN